MGFLKATLGPQSNFTSCFYCLILNKNTPFLLALPDTVKIKRLERWLGRTTTSLVCTNDTARQTNAGLVRRHRGRIHFGKVEEEIYRRTAPCLIKLPSGNTGRGGLEACCKFCPLLSSGAWWLLPKLQWLDERRAIKVSARCKKFKVWCVLKGSAEHAVAARPFCHFSFCELLLKRWLFRKQAEFN